ncbi:MAG TPA: hypothetical protein VFP50_15210 [Anaeromyxobacteraceae bacterium]|nr:hypothetical protein [Anaeromyxobacteraceae bacterium]
MTCSYLEEDVSRFFDREMDAAADRAFLGHLVDCDTCNARLESLMQLDALLEGRAVRIKTAKVDVTVPPRARSERWERLGLAALAVVALAALAWAVSTLGWRP